MPSVSGGFCAFIWHFKEEIDDAMIKTDTWHSSLRELARRVQFKAQQSWPCRCLGTQALSGRQVVSADASQTWRELGTFASSGTLLESSALYIYMKMSQREQLILNIINGWILTISGSYISTGSFNSHSYSIKVHIWQIKRQITRQVNQPIRKCWSWAEPHSMCSKSVLLDLLALYLIS